MSLRFAAFVLFAALLPAQAQTSGEVRIYRCTDAAGKQTLRDTPCPKGQQQQTRDMLRPKDAPKPARAATTTAPVTPELPPTRIVHVVPPQPMYECTTPDGERYTADNGEGNPRWVPYWTLGYPAYGPYPRGSADRGSFRPAPSVNASVGKPQQTLPTPTSVPSPHRGRVPWPLASGGGQWISDTCALLPPAETCARLRDRRDTLRRRFHGAMPSERDVMRVEERGINARLDNDCDGR